MIALPKHKMTADEFLAWAETVPKEEGAFELHDGVVVMRHGPATSQQAERAQHWNAKAAIYAAFRDAIKRAGLPCFAAVDGPSVRLDSGRTYRPDALIYCGQFITGDTLEVANPVVVAEVLSPGTERADYGEKVEGYFSLPSVAHYLIVDPDRPAVVHYARGSDQDLRVHIVHGATLRLDPPGLEVELEEVLGGEGAAGE